GASPRRTILASSGSRDLASSRVSAVEGSVVASAPHRRTFTTRRGATRGGPSCTRKRWRHGPRLGQGGALGAAPEKSLFASCVRFHPPAREARECARKNADAE